MATIYDKGKPTLETAGKVGDIYVDTDTGLHYKCQLAYKDEPNEALSYDWRQIPVDDDMVDYLKLAETERYKHPWANLDFSLMEGGATIGYKFTDMLGEVNVYRFYGDKFAFKGDFDSANGIYYYAFTFHLFNPDNRKHMRYWNTPLCETCIQSTSISDDNKYMTYIQLTDYESLTCQKAMDGELYVWAFTNPSTLIFPNTISLRSATMIYNKSGTARGIVLPNNAKNTVQSNWLSIKGDDIQVTIKKIHGNGLKVKALYLNQKGLVLSDETIKYLVETLGDASDAEEPLSIKLSATNLANISEETHNLAKAKGWLIS